MLTQKVITPACCIAVMAAAGCGISPVPAPSVDQATILQSITGYATSKAFTRVNAQPYPSVIDTGEQINMYVSSRNAPGYEAINPSTHGSGVTLRPGTTIVREVRSKSGQVQALTVMYKGPPGYNPVLGDWWFGVTNPMGVPAANDTGAPQTGRLRQCFLCHIPRQHDDYLFGVPRSARSAGAAAAPHATAPDATAWDAAAPDAGP